MVLQIFYDYYGTMWVDVILYCDIFVINEAYYVCLDIFFVISTFQWLISVAYVLIVTVIFISVFKQTN